MKLLGLIGYPLGHSFSEEYFRAKFENENIKAYSYRNFPISSVEKIDQILDEYPELLGFNVTIPYKEQILPYLDDMDDTAREVGAVNTVKIERKGEEPRLKGFNTDVIGFSESLLKISTELPSSALVLGTGGASKAVVYSLLKIGIKVVMVSSSGKYGAIAYRNIDRTIMEENLLIVNTTPLGTYPDIDSYPDLPYEFIGPGHIAFDLVYNPKLTVFLKKAAARGAQTKNGYEMLTGQAEAAWKIWTTKS